MVFRWPAISARNTRASRRKEKGCEPCDQGSKGPGAMAQVWPTELRALEARYPVALEVQEGYLARVEAAGMHGIVAFWKDSACLESLFPMTRTRFWFA